MALPKETTTGEVICEKCTWLHSECTPCPRKNKQLGTCEMSEWGKTNPHPQNPLCIKWKPTMRVAVLVRTDGDYPYLGEVRNLSTVTTTYGNLLSNDRS